MAEALKTERKWEPSRSGAALQSVPRFAMRHYTVAEIAEMWHLSDDAVRKLFESEPGVLSIGESRSGRKRRYVTLRIPEDVAERVHRRLARA